MVWTRIFGWGFTLFGLLMIVFFTYVWHHQPPYMVNAGVVLGVIFVGIGIFLLKL